MQIQPILGYFWAIFGLYQPPAPPLLDLGHPFLHILDPPLYVHSSIKFNVVQQLGQCMYCLSTNICVTTTTYLSHSIHKLLKNTCIKTSFNNILNQENIKIDLLICLFTSSYKYTSDIQHFVPIVANT